MYLQLAEDGYTLAADNCGLPPIKPLRSRDKAPDKWAEYDRKRAEWEACRAGKGKSTAGIGAIIGMAPGRALFNLMVEFNIDGIATKLAARPWNEIKQWWSKVGGDTNKLAKFINKGKGKKPRKIGLLNKFKAGGTLAEMQNPFLSAYGPSYYLSAELTEQKKAAIIAATTAAGTAVGTIVGPGPGSAAGAGAGASLGAVFMAILPLVVQMANDKIGEDPNVNPPELPTVPEDEPTTTTPGATTDDKIFGLPKKTVMFGAIALGGLGLVYYLTKTPKNK